MKTRTGFSVAVLAAAILLLLPIAPLALAQDQDNYQDNYQDPPTRAGRIGFVQGSVSFQPGGEGDWVEAVPNRPLTTGDNLWVDRDSRAEIQIGSTSIRLGPETSLTFLDLGNDVTQLRLSMGSVFFRVRRFDRDDAFEVDAPNLAFNVSEAGSFRLDVNENGDQTDATVWHGEAVVTGGGDSYRLQAGQQGTFSGTDRLSYDVAGIGSPDDFGRWAMSRDERQDRARSRDYVSDEMTGYEDLDDYGRWHEVSGYGNVWTPVGVQDDWAPYRYGHWVYVSPWGWTWVEDEPWGFAPFHYGRWAYVGRSWCWIPGPVAVRPVYSPALVAFVGGGGRGGFSISVGFGGGGGVGWFPLGPGEVFVPWYRTSPRYVQNVNITNTRVNVVQVTNVYNNVTVNHVTNITYVNQRVNNSVTVVNHDTFVNARPVHNNIVRVDERQIRSAQVTREAVSDIRPARQSVMGAGRPVQMRPPEQAVNRTVVVTRQPVVFARPVTVQGGERTNRGEGTNNPVAPPVRMVRAAPVTEAQPLQRGQRGSSSGFGAPAAGGSRPGAGAPDNGRGGMGRPAEGNSQPGMQGNNPRPGEMAPRPGNSDNGRNVSPQPGIAPGKPAPPQEDRGAMQNNGRNVSPQPGMAPGKPAPPQDDRGAAPANGGNANPQPGAVAPGRPTAPDDNRGFTRDNNRPGHEVPRPPLAMRPQDQAPQGRPDNARPDNARPDNARPDNARPDNARPDNGRPNNAKPDNGPDNARPDNAAPQNMRPADVRPNAPNSNIRPVSPRPNAQNMPDSGSETPNAGPANAPPSNGRPDRGNSQNARPQETPRTMPDTPARPAESRQPSTPLPPRPEAAPETRPMPVPQMEPRREPTPRPDVRPSEPPPQRESRQAENPQTVKPDRAPKEQKPPKEEKEKEKPPLRFR